VGQAALLCEPQDRVAWIEALSLLLTDDEIRDDLEVRGREQAAKFTWEATARATRAVYDRVLEL